MLRIGVLLLKKDGGKAAYALSPQERGEGAQRHATPRPGYVPYHRNSRISAFGGCPNSSFTEAGSS